MKINEIKDLNSFVDLQDEEYINKFSNLMVFGGPRAYSTLAQAAQWMAGSTNVEWTSDSLLDFIYREMSKKLSEEYEKSDELDEEYDEEYDEVIASRAAQWYVCCLTVSLPPTTRVVYRFSTSDTPLNISNNDRGENPLLELNKCRHVEGLLMHGAIELPYPLTSEPWNGADGYCIDAATAPIITPESLRIEAYHLVYLAMTFNEQNKQGSPLTSIDVLDLSPRAKGRLKYGEIHRIDELTMCCRSDLLRIQALGLETLNEIRKKLALQGLKLHNEKLDIETLINLALDSKK